MHSQPQNTYKKNSEKKKSENALKSKRIDECRKWADDDEDDDDDARGFEFFV